LTLSYTLQGTFVGPSEGPRAMSWLGASFLQVRRAAGLDPASALRQD
jgi:hypothetical protein